MFRDKRMYNLLTIRKWRDLIGFSDNSLKIILLESSLELVPREIANHPSVVNNARKRGKKPFETLLDVSLHYHAMLKLREREKRGRPDIVHVSLLFALESPLNKKKKLELYIHTYPGDIIFINPETRIPRNYNRFVGLIEQLLINGKIPPNSDNPLMFVKTMDIDYLFKEIDINGLILLSEKGVYKKPFDIVKESIENNYLIGIGGFPHSDFSKYIVDKSIAQYSIYSEPLMTWIVLSRILIEAERYFNLF